MDKVRLTPESDISGNQTPIRKVGSRWIYTPTELLKMEPDDLWGTLSSLQSVIDHRGDYYALIEVVDKLKDYINNYDSKD